MVLCQGLKPERGHKPMTNINLQFFAEGEEVPAEAMETPEGTSTEEVEAAETEPTENESEFSQADTDFLSRFEVQYNKEGKHFESLADLKEHAERGLNYQKVKDQREDFKSQLETMQNSRQSKYMTKFLKDNGFDNFESYEDALEVDALVQEGMSEDRAQEHIKGQRSLKADEKAKSKIDLDASMEEFVKAFPDVKDIPQEVMDEFSKGNGKLEDIYADFNKGNEIKELKDKLAKYENQEEISTKNKTNAGLSTGSMTGNGASDSIYTREQVKNMSKTDVKKNYNKIVKDMKTWK